jgi:DNA excision repair protein ERCC-1
MNPIYIQTRFDELKSAFDLRVLLVLLDHRADPSSPLTTSTDQIVELNKLCVVSNFTLILASTLEEAGRWIETFKIYENKDPSSIIMKRLEGVDVNNPTDSKKGKGSAPKTVSDQVIATSVSVLTQIKSVSRKDAMALITEFDTVGDVFRAGGGELSLIDGMGDKKVKRLVNVMRKSWNVKKKSSTGLPMGAEEEEEDDEGENELDF